MLREKKSRNIRISKSNLRLFSLLQTNTCNESKEITMKLISDDPEVERIEAESSLD